MSNLRSIRTDRAPGAIGPYSQAIHAGSVGLVFCSGQIGMDPATGNLVAGGVGAETRQCLRNVEAVLGAAGSSLAGVVRTVLYLADMQDFAAVNTIYAEVFREPFPARSTVQAAGLPKGARVEMEITAVVTRRAGAESGGDRGSSPL